MVKEITTEQELLAAFGNYDPHYKDTYPELFIEEMRTAKTRNLYVIRVPEGNIPE